MMYGILYNTEMSKCLLIADDDAMFIDILRLEFEKHDLPWEVLTVTDGERTLRLVEERSPHLLLLDLRMPKVAGFAVPEALKQKQSPLPVVVITNYHDDAHKRRSAEYGVRNYIVKSEWRLGQIVAEIGRHLA